MSLGKKIFLLVIFLLAALIAAWYFFGGTAVIALKAEKQDAIKGITVTGNVESSEDIKITAQVTARIEEITVNNGDTVEKGQVLSYLNREELIGAVNAAEARIAVIQQQLERNRVQIQDAVSDEKRYEELFEQGAVSKRDLEERSLRRLELEEQIDQREQEISAARGDLKAAQGKLENYIIKAPLSGIITNKFVSTGDIVSPQQKLFRLVVPEFIYLEADVEENALEAVKPGQTTMVIFDAYPHRIYEGQVYLITKEVDPVTGTFEARITRPEEPDLKIFVGMTFDATIVIEDYTDVLIIPSDFVEMEDSKAFVFRQKNGFASKTPVRIDFFNNNAVRVLEGLQEGEVILKKAEPGKLTDNAKIRIIEFREQ